VLDDKEVLVFQHVGRVFGELRNARIENVAEGSVGVLDVAVAACAIRLIDFHSGDEVGIGGLKRVLCFGSAAIDGGIEGRHRDAALEPADRQVRTRVHKAEAHVAEANGENHDNGYYKSKEKLEHGGCPSS
jgi:hypothetical protein